MDAQPIVKELASGRTSVGELRGVGPAQIEALYALGHGLYSRGRLDDAAEVFGLLTVYESTDPRFWFARGATALERRALPEAITSFGFAALLDPRDAWALVHLGECLLLHEEIETAREALERAVARASEVGDEVAGQRAMGFLRYPEVRHG
jgi:Flp pilus assembly protein TadD